MVISPHLTSPCCPPPSPSFCQDAILDFFGAAVKAQELLLHSMHMRLMSRRVESSAAGGRDPCATFKLDVALQMTVPKWGKLINWGPKDDAMLLLGEWARGAGTSRGEGARASGEARQSPPGIHN